MRFYIFFIDQKNKYDMKKVRKARKYFKKRYPRKSVEELYAIVLRMLRKKRKIVYATI